MNFASSPLASLNDAQKDTSMSKSTYDKLVADVRQHIHLEALNRAFDDAVVRYPNCRFYVGTRSGSQYLRITGAAGLPAPWELA